MPRDDRRWFHNDERRSPLPPDMRQPDPQQTIRHCQWHPPRPCALQHMQLVPQGRELGVESSAGARDVAHGQEEQLEHRHDCG
jgi:hypothetical protein